MDPGIIAFLPLALKFAVDFAVTTVAWVTGVFTILFCAAATACAIFFFRLRRKPRSLAQPPPVSIIKPLKGLDRGLYENLRSFCTLDYPRYQLLFTLDSPDDPALAVLLRLRSEFPNLDMEIIVSKNRIGHNPKINNASNALPYIKHGLLLFSDSDIHVQTDFLRRMTAALTDERVGLVTAFYQAQTPRGFWAQLESLFVNAHFLPQAIVAAAFGMRFAMGAAMLVRREAFERSGGFQNMAGHLADDFILGEGVKAAGFSIEMAHCVVDSLPDRGGALECLRHQARWARTIHLCNPDGYLGSGLLQGFSFLTLKLALLGPDAVTLALTLGVLLARALAKTILSRSCLGDRQGHACLMLLPLSEWVSCGAWLSGFKSTRVLWRGQIYSTLPRGRLAPVNAATNAPTPVAVP